MSAFSIRNGLHTKLFQKNTINNELKISLWNFIYTVLKKEIQHGAYNGYFWTNGMEDVLRRCWTDFFYFTIDTFLKRPSEFLEDFKTRFFTLKWNQIYDLLEFFAKSLPNSFQEKCNVILERENSAYRFVHGIIAEIVTDEHILSIEQAIQSPYHIINEHYKKSLTFLSNKVNPDFKNSIKESISAVEGLMRILTDRHKLTLGEILKNPKINCHPILIDVLKKLYGFANNQSGVRHSNKENAIEMDYDDAILILIVCSAFTNHIINKNSKQTFDKYQLVTNV